MPGTKIWNWIRRSRVVMIPVLRLRNACHVHGPGDFARLADASFGTGVPVLVCGSGHTSDAQLALLCEPNPQVCICSLNAFGIQGVCVQYLMRDGACFLKVESPNHPRERPVLRYPERR